MRVLVYAHAYGMGCARDRMRLAAYRSQTTREEPAELSAALGWAAYLGSKSTDCGQCKY